MTAQENKVDKETQKQTDKQGDTQHQTAQRTAARRSAIHPSPFSFSLLPSPSPLFFSSPPFSHTLKNRLSPKIFWPPWYTRHDKKSHNDKCNNKPRWEEKRLLDARLRARRASLWRDNHTDGNYRGAGAKRLRNILTKVVRTIR